MCGTKKADLIDSRYPLPCPCLPSSPCILLSSKPTPDTNTHPKLDQLVTSFNLPTAVTPDRTPMLSAAVAGARGILPARLRRMVAASNRAALTGFPHEVASAISAGRCGIGARNFARGLCADYLRLVICLSSSETSEEWFGSVSRQHTGSWHMRRQGPIKRCGRSFLIIFIHYCVWCTASRGAGVK